MRRKVWMGWVAGVAFLLAGSMPALSAEKVLYCADWALYGKHTPYIIARDKGFFKDEGIDITIRRGYGSSDTTKRVGSKECPYGMAAMGPQVIGKNKGFNIKTVGILEHKFQEIIYYFSDAGINTPKDLEGKRVTPGPKASADYAMFPVFAAPNGIDMAKINWIFMAPGSQPASLGAGRVDAVISYHTQKPRFLKVAKQAGKTLKWILYADRGLDLYSAGILTHTDNLKGSGVNTTRGMVKAIYRGIAYHPGQSGRRCEGLHEELPGAVHQERHRHLAHLGGTLVRRTLRKTGTRPHRSEKDEDDHQGHPGRPEDAHQDQGRRPFHQ